MNQGAATFAVQTQLIWAFVIITRFFLKSLFNDHTFLQYRYISAMCSIVSSHFMHCLCSSKYPGTTQRKAIYSPFFLKAKIHNNKGIFKSLANSFITVYQLGMFALGTKTT